MPRQRRGPRPQGRAARQLASVCRQSASANRLAPTPVPQRPRSFSKTAANRSVQERILSNAGPLSVRAGRKILNPADFLPIMHRSGKRSDAAPSPQSSGIPARTRRAKRRRTCCEAGGKTGIETPDSKSFRAVPAGRPRPAGRQRINLHTSIIAPQRTPTPRARPTGAGPLSQRAGRKMVNPADFLPIMLRSGKRSDAAPLAAKQAKKRGRNARFKLLPCRAKGAAPVRKDGRHGNWHPSAAKAPAPTASPRRLCLKGRAAFQKLPPIAAYRNAFCRMLARSL